jgi:hypothetical protein
MQTSFTKLLSASKPLKSRLAIITALMVGDEDLPQATLDAAYDHHDRLNAMHIVLTRLASAKGARINEAAIATLQELLAEATAYLAQPEVAELVGPIEA